MTQPYRPRRPWSSSVLTVRGLRTHVRSWGDPSAPPLVLLHGSRDCSVTFQFVVDAFEGAWHVIAPDWRGHGETDPAPGGYWFPDYLADLDGVLDLVAPDGPVPLVGHSLGGNAASLYAALRPERVTHLVSLDAFGLPERSAAEAPAHLRRWLDGCRTAPGHRVQPDVAALADRLQAGNGRLDRSRALFLAEHSSRPVPGGRIWAFDPGHRLPFATMHRVAEWEACVSAVTAPVLWIGSDQPFPSALARDPSELQRRIELARAAFRRLPGTGHNLHHDEPEKVARLVEAFVGGRHLPTFDAADGESGIIVLAKNVNVNDRA